MKRFLSVLALVAPLALSVPAGAQQTKPDTKKVPLIVAVVDGTKLTQAAKSMREAQEEAEKLAKKFDADFAAEQKKLQTEYQQLEKDRLKITGQDYDRRLQRLNQRFADIRRTAQIRQEQMSRAVRVVQVQFRAEVVKVIQAMAVEAGYTLVLERSAVLHAAAQLDITDEVLERLDKAKINVKFEFPPKADASAPPARPGAPGKPQKKTN
ncbi:MAG: OmpH family outer membrane protein [Rhodospirillaceae bacterium]|nr:OmpH family outer membrane protein [Rhodospirillaceae bacterium]